MNYPAFYISDLLYILPEILLFLGGGVVLVKDAFSPDQTKYQSYVIAQITLIIALLLSLFIGTQETIILQSHYIADSLTNYARSIILLLSIFSLAFAKDYLLAHQVHKSEFYVLALYATLGTLVMISANSLLVLYLGVEMLALSTYVLVAFNPNSRLGAESAMKYFILGAVASGFLLYGMSMAYGAAGSLDMQEIAAKSMAVIEAGSLSANLPLMLAMVFLLAGILFKLGAAPFHMWIPDVYQGASAGTVTMMSAAPKVAYFVMLARVVLDVFGDASADWQPILIVVALLSIVIGNLIAIMQTEIKRMLAYSTISHIGFMLLGIAAAGQEGAAVGMFYVITYAIAAVATMGIVVAISHQSEDKTSGDVPIQHLAGLMKQSPAMAVVLILSMMSMAGIPILSGFFAKLAVIMAVVGTNLVWLAVLAILFSVVGAYYYLRVIKAACFDEAEQPINLIPLGRESVIFLAFNGILLIIIGLMPQKLISLCQSLF